MPSELIDRDAEVWPAVMRSLALNVAGPRTPLHQDVHPGNWLKDPSGRMGLYDWQCVGVGGWALDYSYALAGLETANRRESEEDRRLSASFIGPIGDPQEPADTLVRTQAWKYIDSLKVGSASTSWVWSSIGRTMGVMASCSRR